LQPGEPPRSRPDESGSSQTSGLPSSQDWSPSLEEPPCNVATTPEPDHESLEDDAHCQLSFRLHPSWLNNVDANGPPDQFEKGSGMHQPPRSASPPRIVRCNSGCIVAPNSVTRQRPLPRMPDNAEAQLQARMPQALQKVPSEGALSSRAVASNALPIAIRDMASPCRASMRAPCRNSHTSSAQSPSPIPLRSATPTLHIRPSSVTALQIPQSLTGLTTLQTPSSPFRQRPGSITAAAVPGTMLATALSHPFVQHPSSMLAPLDVVASPHKKPATSTCSGGVALSPGLNPCALDALALAFEEIRLGKS
jgi:hypothetical protein